MKLPAYEPSLAPAGRFIFEVDSHPDLRVGGSGKTFIIFKLKIIFKEGGSRKLNHIFWPSEPRYRDVLDVLGGKKDGDKIDLDESRILGKQFKGEIIHVQDKQDPTLIREKIINIRAMDEISQLYGDESEQEDPFDKDQG